MGGARAGEKPFLLFLSPNSHPLGKFDTLAILCMMCTNLDPTVRLLQPCGHVRTEYETEYLQPFDFNCNVVNTPLDGL